jgi:hypothetical protein
MALLTLPPTDAGGIPEDKQTRCSADASITRSEALFEEAAALARALEPLTHAQILGLINQAILRVVAEDAARRALAESVAREAAWLLAKLEDIALEEPKARE